MNKWVCWNCEKEFEYDGEQYRDVNCPHCGVQNSIYNPADYQPEQEEEEMPSIYDANEFLVPQEVKDGDIITFEDAGVIATKDYSKNKDGSDMRTQLTIKIKLPNGKVKKFSVNKTSRNDLGATFGPETEKWVGKKAKILLLKQNVGGQIRDVVYLTPEK